MAEFLKVHHLSEDANTKEVKVVRTTPYIRIQSGGGPTPLFLKQGRVADENGVEQKPVPLWVWQEAAKCTPVALREVGFDPKFVAASASGTNEEQVEVQRLDEPDAEPTDLEDAPPPPRPVSWRERAKAMNKAR